MRFHTVCGSKNLVIKFVFKVLIFNTTKKSLKQGGQEYRVFSLTYLNVFVIQWVWKQFWLGGIIKWSNFFPVVVANTCFWTMLKIKSEMPIFVCELHVVSSFFALPHSLLSSLPIILYWNGLLLITIAPFQKWSYDH